MNILVTGATGFIGMHLVKELTKEHTIHLLIRSTTDIVHLTTKNFFVFDDNINELSIYLKQNEIDGIVHLASLYIAQHHVNEIKDLILSNIYLGTAILEASVTAGVKWFLNTGTIWQNYISNSKEYCPVNLYAATKQALIDLAKYYTETSSIQFCTLKLCDTYGPKDTRKKILTLFKEISETGETLDMSPGEQKIDLLHIDDVVDGFIKLILLLDNQRANYPEYVLTSSRLLTLKELAELYQNISNKKLYINWGGKSYRPREVMIPWQKGIKVPDWNSSISLQLALKKFEDND